MVKLKNYNVVLKHFVLLLTFALLFSCAGKKYYVTKIEGKEIAINEKNDQDADIENFINPYRTKIDADLNTILSQAPKTIDKSGEWQTPMGNFLSDITLEQSNKVFSKREGKSISMSFLNHGGIRSIIPQGDITIRTAFEVMPFENSVVVVGLKKEQILELIQYIITEKKPHPLSGLSFTIDKSSEPKNILIQGKPIDDGIYYVATSDYLYNGGDNITFFKKGIEKYDLEYKLRNIIIDYFKDHKIIEANTNTRITKE